MKIITQSDFDAIAPSADGVRYFPGSVDYSGIQSFGEGARFGEGACFGEGARFGKGASFGPWARFGDGCNANSPYWGLEEISPYLKIKGRIFPYPSYRDHWSARIGVPLEGCWEEIGDTIRPLLPGLVQRTDWSPTERAIVGSWAKWAEKEKR